MIPLQMLNFRQWVLKHLSDSIAQRGGGGIIVRDSIPSEFLGNLSSDEDSEGLFIELNLRNTKWILFAGYNPRRVRISPFLSNIEHIAMII